MKKPVLSLPRSTIEALTRYAWPGNIRELENLIERSVILSRAATLEVPLGELHASTEGLAPTPAGGRLEEVKRAHISRALQESGWVLSGPHGAAARLGMKRTTLQNAMTRLGIGRKSP